MPHYDGEKIDKQIGQPVLEKHPQISPLVKRFQDEGAGFYSLCIWLNDFVESIAWLTGNRPLSIYGTCLKNVDGRRFGVVEFPEDEERYVVVSRDANELWTYVTAFDMALDGWSVD